MEGAWYGKGEEAYAQADSEHFATAGSGQHERKDATDSLPGAGIPRRTFYRWRKENGGLKTDRAKRLKELVQENSKLKRLGRAQSGQAAPSRHHPGKLLSPGVDELLGGG